MGAMENLTPEEMEELRRVVHRAIEASRYPLSRATLMHKDILAKIGGEDRRPKPASLPHPNFRRHGGVHEFR
jgi:hypothetical protein